MIFYKFLFIDDTNIIRNLKIDFERKKLQIHLRESRIKEKP